MIMTDQELLSDYKAAKKKKEQIQILAERNCVPVKEMEAKLIELGADISKQGRPKKIDKTIMAAVKQEVEENQEAPKVNITRTGFEIEKPEAKTTEAEKQTIEGVPKVVKKLVTEKMVEIQSKIDILEAELQELADFSRRWS